MKDEEIKHFYKKAYKEAFRITRNREDSEDAAQRVLETWIKHKKVHGIQTKQSTAQATIDAIRAHFGDKYSIRSNARKLLNSHDFNSNLQIPVGHTHPNQNAFVEIPPNLSQLDRCMFILAVKWGFNNEELSECFNVTSSRIHQKLKTIRNFLKNQKVI